MIPYLNMCSKVVIGNVAFHQVSSIDIWESVKELGDTATVVLARNMQKLKGKPVQDYIKTGDRVTIYAGYNDSLALEFEGYVKKIGSEIPLVISCDDMFYPLKQNNLVQHWDNVTLKQVLQFIAPGYTIDCPAMILGELAIDNWSSFKVLKHLQHRYGLFFRIKDNNTLVTSLSYQWDTSRTRNHKYHFQKNVKASALVWKDESDFDVRVEVNIQASVGNKKKKVQYGSSKDKPYVDRMDFDDITEAEAKKIAEAKYTKMVYTGFTGYFTGFGSPRTHAGDSVTLEHAYEPEKNGSYLLEAMKLRYNRYDGWCRDNYVAYKI